MDNKLIPGGLFISFEGSECSGKSTQTELLAAYLRDQGYRIVETREPGGTVVGEDIRKIVKHLCGEDAVCDEAELFLFCASRAQLMKKCVLPHLQQGGIVICDRFADSTTAYQGYGRGFDLDYIHQLHRITTMGRWPDLTFLLDLEAEKISRRSQLRSNDVDINDRIGDESLVFHQKIRKGYLTIASQNDRRIQVLDASCSPNSIHNKIAEKVDNVISKLRSSTSDHCPETAQSQTT